MGGVGAGRPRGFVLAGRRRGVGDQRQHGQGDCQRAYERPRSKGLGRATRQARAHGQMSLGRFCIINLMDYQLNGVVSNVIPRQSLPKCYYYVLGK